MTAPLSGKQKREDMKFLFDELRKTVALRKDQRRKDALAKQQMDHKEQTQQVRMVNMGAVPPKMGKPTNPEAGPNDKIPALLAPGEAVIPAKAAQKPENKPLIKAMVKEGRSDRNLSVPMPKGFMCGTEKVKGYEYGTTYVDEFGNYSDYIMDQQPVYEAPVPKSVVVIDAPPQKIVNPNVPVQALNETDNASFTRGKESSGNFDIGYHNLDKSSAFGAYGLTEAAYKDIQKADPYFAKKPITDLSADDQTTAFKVYENVLADQLRAKEIEPTTENLRGAYLLGAQGLKNWQTKGELSEEAIKANGGRDKLISIIKDRTGTGVQRVADNVLTAISGSANATEVPKVNNKDAQVEEYYKRDPNRVQVTENNGVYTFESIADQDKRLAKEKQKQEALYGTTPQGATQDFAIDENGMPYKVNTEQEKQLFNQVNEIAQVPKVQTKEPQGWMSYISKGLVDGLSNAWDTIKDPNKFAAATSSFIKDTIGLEGADAVRFATLYYGQKALGISDQGAALYAGKYTLGQMDKRADRRATQATQLMTTNKSHIQTLFKERRLSKEGYDLAMKANATGNFGAVDAILAHPNFVTARESAGLIDSKGKEINIVKRGGLNQVVSAYADPSSPGNYLTVTRDKDGKEVVAQLSGKDYRRWSSDFDSVNKVRSFLEQSVDSSKLSRVDDKGKSIPIFKGYGKDSVVNDMMSYYREKEKAGLDTDPAQYVEAAHAAIDHAAKTGEKTPSIKAMLYAYEMNPGMFADQKKLSYDGEKGKPIETSRIGTFTKDVAEYSKGRTTDKGKALNPSEYLSGITSAYNEKVDRKQYEKNIDDPTLLSKIKEAPNSYMAYVYWNFYQHSKK
jgi:hypothetical protein